jgi:hypothetical protein
MAALPPKPGLAGLIRQAGQDAKRDALRKAPAVDGQRVTSADNVFNILEYIESDWGLHMTLFPVQRFIVKLYYFLELDDTLPEEDYLRIKVRDVLTGNTRYTFTEKQYLEYLFNQGRCNIGAQDHERRDLFLALGRRAGKTALSAVFASYEVYRLLNLYNPQAYYGLPDGNRIQIISVATDKDQAGILFNEVAGHLAKCDYFRPYQANNTQSQVNFRTPFDIDKYGAIYRENGKYTSFSGKASVRLTFKGATGKGLRGAGNIVIILDEFAHFLDTGPGSAEEIYTSVTPSAAAFSPKDPTNPMLPVGGKESRVVCISSPLGKSGRFFELFDQAMRGGKGATNMLGIQAPTWEVNPTVPLSDLQQAYYSDATSFNVEYGAQFSDQLSGWIEREEDLQACIEPESRPITRGPPRRPHNMGIDVGLVDDGTFIVVNHIEQDRIVLDYHEGWRAGEDWRETNPHLLGQYSTEYSKTLKDVQRLDFDQIADWIHLITRRFHIKQGLFDRWNGIPLEQSLTKKGLKQFTSEHFTRDQTSKMYQATKSMMYNETLLIYDFPLPKHSIEVGAARHSPHIDELLSLRAKSVAKDVVIVSAPKKKGAHDDFADAYVRSVWLCFLEMSSEKFISHGYSDNRPFAASAATMTNFRALRARQHGLPPRQAPGGGRRGSLRFAR